MLFRSYLEHPRELEIALLEAPDGSVSAYGPGEVFPGREFYDYDAKYVSGVSTTTVSPQLSETLREDSPEVVGAHQTLETLQALLKNQISTANDGLRSYLQKLNQESGEGTRLPMLEIVLDRFVRSLNTTMRNFTSENVDIAMDNVAFMKYGDYLNSIPMPTMIASTLPRSACTCVQSNCPVPL